MIITYLTCRAIELDLMSVLQRLHLHCLHQHLQHLHHHSANLHQMHHHSAMPQHLNHHGAILQKLHHLGQLHASFLLFVGWEQERVGTNQDRISQAPQTLGCMAISHQVVMRNGRRKKCKRGSIEALCSRIRMR